MMRWAEEKFGYATLVYQADVFAFLQIQKSDRRNSHAINGVFKDAETYVEGD